jgi:predicted permease
MVLAGQRGRPACEQFPIEDGERLEGTMLWERNVTIFNAFSGVLTVFMMGALGYLLARRGFIGPELKTLLPRFTTFIVLPPYLLRTITTTLDRDQLLHLFASGAIPFLSIFFTFALAVALSRILRVPEKRSGIFRVGFANSNAMNIGLPINIALFGEVAVPYVLVYFFANAFTFWTIGNYSIAKSGGSAPARLCSRETLKQLFSPPLAGFLCGLLLVYFELNLPGFIDKTFKYVGDMAIALGTMYAGITMHGVTLRECRLDKDILAVFAGRFLISPLSILALTWWMPVPTLMRSVFIIQCSLPVMLNVSVLSAYYQADTRYAAVITSLTMLASIVTIPLYMALISAFWS